MRGAGSSALHLSHHVMMRLGEEAPRHPGHHAMVRLGGRAHRAQTQWQPTSSRGETV